MQEDGVVNILDANRFAAVVDADIYDASLSVVEEGDNLFLDVEFVCILTLKLYIFFTCRK